MSNHYRYETLSAGSLPDGPADPGGDAGQETGLPLSARRLPLRTAAREFNRVSKQLI